MKSTANENPATNRCAENKSYEQKRTSHERPMHIPSVTQVTPENQASAGERIVPTGKTESPSQQELEQDVAATNPSVESMQSRG